MGQGRGSRMGQRDLGGSGKGRPCPFPLPATPCIRRGAELLSQRRSMAHLHARIPGALLQHGAGGRAAQLRVGEQQQRAVLLVRLVLVAHHALACTAWARTGRAWGGG